MPLKTRDNYLESHTSANQYLRGLELTNTAFCNILKHILVFHTKYASDL